MVMFSLMCHGNTSLQIFYLILTLLTLLEYIRGSFDIGIFMLNYRNCINFFHWVSNLLHELM